MKSLLIHHHTVAYVSPEGIWVQSFIGTWVNSIAPYFEKIGLLLHETKIKGPKQDTLIPFNNIILESLGPVGRTWDWLQRNNRIKTKCMLISGDYEGLLIRGVTPRGYTVFKHTQIIHKYFLLVGSLDNSKPRFELSRLYSYIMYYIRRAELKKMGKTLTCLSNSVTVADEFSKLIGKKVYFSPTSSIANEDIPPYRETEIQSDELKLLFCGRITCEKGVFELFRAIQPLSENLGRKIKLVMIGSIDQSLKLKLMKIAKKGGFESDIEWLGFISFGKDLLTHFQKAHFCILPSYHEGFPHTIWEAGICSVPMVVTPVGGIVGMVSEKEVIFIEPKSVKSIVEVLSKLVSQSADLKELTKALYTLSSKFTLEKNAEILFNIIMSNQAKIK